MPLGLWHGHADHAAGLLGELERVQGTIGIADAPELFGITQEAGGDQVEPVALGHGHFDQERHRIAAGHETPPHIGDDSPIRHGVVGGFDSRVSAGVCKHRSLPSQQGDVAASDGLQATDDALGGHSLLSDLVGDKERLPWVVGQQVVVTEDAQAQIHLAPDRV